MLIGARRRAHRGYVDAGVLPAPVSAVISTPHQTRSETPIALGKAHCGGSIAGARISGISPRAADTRLFRMIGLPSFVSTAKPICSGLARSPERRKLIEEADAFTEEFHGRIARTGFEPMVSALRPVEPRSRPGSRT